MRPSRIWRILQIKEGVIHKAEGQVDNTLLEFFTSYDAECNNIALLFIQNISPFLKEFRHFTLCLLT